MFIKVFWTPLESVCHFTLTICKYSVYALRKTEVARSLELNL